MEKSEVIFLYPPHPCSVIQNVYLNWRYLVQGANFLLFTEPHLLWKICLFSTTRTWIKYIVPSLMFHESQNTSVYKSDGIKWQMCRRKHSSEGKRRTLLHNAKYCSLTQCSVVSEFCKQNTTIYESMTPKITNDLKIINEMSIWTWMNWVLLNSKYILNSNSILKLNLFLS